jgi:hypothetical protein
MACLSSRDTPAQHAEDVYSVAQGNTPPIGLDQVSASWRRSAIEHRVDPLNSEAPRILLPHELKDFREPLDELIFIAQEEIDRLYRVVREAGYTVLLCDTAGIAVEHRGDNADANRFRYWGTWLGGMWSEAMEGTNGIGTCIAEERPITVHRGQHFRSRHTDLSCSAAPVFDVDGTLMAVLDVSAIDPQLSERAHALTGALTATAARAISGRLFREGFRREWIVAVSPIEDHEPGMLLAVDGNQRIVGANRAARTSLLLDDQRLRTGVSLWAFFERDLALFRPMGMADITAKLTIAGSTDVWPALVTPPENALGARLRGTRAALHTRPRLNTLAGLRQQPPPAQARGGLPPGAMRRVREYVDATSAKAWTSRSSLLLRVYRYFTSHDNSSNRPVSRRTTTWCRGASSEPRRCWRAPIWHCRKLPSQQASRTRATCRVTSVKSSAPLRENFAGRSVSHPAQDPMPSSLAAVPPRMAIFWSSLRPGVDRM